MTLSPRWMPLAALLSLLAATPVLAGGAVPERDRTTEARTLAQNQRVALGEPAAAPQPSGTPAPAARVALKPLPPRLP